MGWQVEQIHARRLCDKYRLIGNIRESEEANRIRYEILSQMSEEYARILCAHFDLFMARHWVAAKNADVSRIIALLKSIKDGEEKNTKEGDDAAFDASKELWAMFGVYR